MLDSSAVARGDALDAPGAIERLIDRARARPLASQALSCLSFAAPLVPAERLLGLRAGEHAYLWATADDDECSGVGAMRTLSAAGASRCIALRDQATRVFHDLASIALDDSAPPQPRLVGGLAFDAEPSQSAMWHGFGAALFVLPRVAYTRRGERAWLTITADRAEVASMDGRGALAREARQALACLTLESASTAAQSGAATARAVPPQIEESREQWWELVSGICAEIAAGRLEKAVAARRVAVRSARLPHATEVLERLRFEARGCTRFALRIGARTFLGASPECLVRRTGRQVVTEALAGSMPRAAPDADASLRRSAKETAEHAIVVREIRTALAPFCARIASDVPVPLRLRHLLHLRTRIVATLARPQHVLDLVAALHPTPAVGGTPRRAALAWLAAHEQADRGFYGGPFGAFDGDGDGHFVVAIRSGLLHAGVAHLFAGAGIVAGSHAGTEWTETRWKLRSLMTAIGVG
jgi:isochorismate synthase